MCDRLWFTGDLKQITEADAVLLLKTGYFDSVDGFSACHTCRSNLKQGKIPTLSKSKGFTYPKYPTGLPPLDPITERLISPRLPFIQIHRLRHATGVY